MTEVESTPVSTGSESVKRKRESEPKPASSLQPVLDQSKGEVKEKDDKSHKRQRKTKKMKDKKKKKQLSKMLPQNVKFDENESNEAYLAYVQSWHTDREHWKFNKMKQIWLLNNLYDCTKIPNNFFIKTLRHLKGLQGLAKQRCLEDARKYVQEHSGDMKKYESREEEESDSESEADGEEDKELSSEDAAVWQLKRRKAVLRMLRTRPVTPSY